MAQFGKEGRDLIRRLYDELDLDKVTSKNSKKKKDLPWWVELLFVQIGLPDKLLIKILKANK